jgi:hypothetical protein
MSSNPIGPRIIACGLLIVGLGGLTGCGYQAGGLQRDGIQTVHVEMFGSRVFRRDIEFTLTEAIKKRIAMDTPYRLAPKNRADSVLRGEVLEVRQSAYAPDPVSRIPRETQLTLAVRVQWQNLHTGELEVDQPVQLQAVDYSRQLGESEAFALDQATDRLARKITELMYAEW